LALSNIGYKLTLNQDLIFPHACARYLQKRPKGTLTMLSPVDVVCCRFASQEVSTKHVGKRQLIGLSISINEYSLHILFAEILIQRMYREQVEPILARY
jgi:hypothetical protein